MQYMGSVKNNYFAAIFFIVFVYFIFLVWDWRVNNAVLHQSEIKISNAKKISSTENIKGIIFGGSNSYYSLSANMISNDLGEIWYNGSILNTGYSTKNHYEFIKNIASVVNINEVRTIVLSLVQPYELGEIKQREKNIIKVDGGNYFSLKPLFSGANYIKRILNKTSSNQPPFLYGDFNFNFKCSFDSQSASSFAREDVVLVSEYLFDHINYLHKLFSRAKVIVVFPSGYYGKNFKENLDLSFRIKIIANLKQRIENQAATKQISYDVLFQPPFTSEKYMCDSPWHANEAGRLWRTNNLLMYLKGSKMKID